MNYVRDILKEKGSGVYWVNPQTSILDALKMMAEKNVGALLVLEKAKITGIISERDFAHQIARLGACPMQQAVGEFMITEVIVVPPDASINECMQLMTREHIRHLPVVDQGMLAGIISIGDVVKAVISGHKSTIKSLENYILGQDHSQ